MIYLAMKPLKTYKNLIVLLSLMALIVGCRDGAAVKSVVVEKAANTCDEREQNETEVEEDMIQNIVFDAYMSLMYIHPIDKMMELKLAIEETECCNDVKRRSYKVDVSAKNISGDLICFYRDHTAQIFLNPDDGLFYLLDVTEHESENLENVCHTYTTLLGHWPTDLYHGETVGAEFVLPDYIVKPGRKYQAFFKIDRTKAKELCWQGTSGARIVYGELKSNVVHIPNE